MICRNSSTIQQHKYRMRAAVLKKLNKQKEVVRLQKSFLIFQKLFNSFQFRWARTILFYASFDGEVETLRMIAHALSRGKRVALPLISRNNRALTPALIDDCDYSLAPGPLGIPQPRRRSQRPLALHTIDLVIVPGLAFDTAGHRLGRGMGYYDSLLSRMPRRTASLGLAFDFQIFSSVPHHRAHDVCVDSVLFA